MDILFLLISNLIPLYILIGLGWISGRYMDVNLHSMAIIAINILAPVVVFGAVAQLEFESTYLLLPLIMAGISTFMAITNYSLASFIFKDDTANLVGLGCTTGNTGYFGLPIVLLFTGPEGAGIYLLANMGSEFVANTLGYYLGAKSGRSMGDALKVMLKLPATYAMILGILWNLYGTDLPDVFISYWERFTGAWVIIGMMLIGVALGKLNLTCLKPMLQIWFAASRFLLWPAVMIGLIFLDRHVLKLFDGQIHTLFLIFGTVPLQGNLAAFAAKLGLRPTEAAFAVLVTTFLSLLIMPLAFLLLDAPFNGGIPTP